MSFEGIDIAAKNRILEVTLGNPPDNRLTPSIFQGLNEAANRLESDDFDLMVITGSKKVFSKGFDVELMMSLRDRTEFKPILVLFNTVFSRIARSRKLTIAVINGACMGGGLELAMACHLRVCAEKTRLGLPEVWIKLVPGLGGFYRLARLVGVAKALELVAVGDLISAEEALRLNLVSRVYPRDNFAEHVASFVGNLATADQNVIRQVIRLAEYCAPPGEEDNIRLGVESIMELLSCLPKT